MRAPNAAEAKLPKSLGLARVRLVPEEWLPEIAGCKPGFIGPIGLKPRKGHDEVPVYVDRSNLGWGQVYHLHSALRCGASLEVGGVRMTGADRLRPRRRRAGRASREAVVHGGMGRPARR